MSGEAPVLTRTWRVGRYDATLTVPALQPGEVAHAVIYWEPEVPQKLSTSEMETYQRGLRAALASLGKSAMLVTV